MRKTTSTKRFEDIRQRLAHNLARIRAERRLTLEQIEERSGIPVRDIERIEAGNGNSTVTTVTLLANALLADPVELVARVQLDPRTNSIVRGPSGRR